MLNEVSSAMTFLLFFTVWFYVQRGKFIEYAFESVRVSPFYIPKSNPVSDVLFVTNEHIDRRQFCLWQRLLECFRLSVDFWDTERYHGLSSDLRTGNRHEVSTSTCT